MLEQRLRVWEARVMRFVYAVVVSRDRRRAELPLKVFNIIHPGAIAIRSYKRLDCLPDDPRTESGPAGMSIVKPSRTPVHGGGEQATGLRQ